MVRDDMDLPVLRAEYRTERPVHRADDERREERLPEPADAEHPVTQEWIDETIAKLLPETANV